MAFGGSGISDGKGRSLLLLVLLPQVVGRWLGGWLIGCLAVAVEKDDRHMRGGRNGSGAVSRSRGQLVMDGVMSWNRSRGVGNCSVVEGDE